MDCNHLILLQLLLFDFINHFRHFLHYFKLIISMIFHIRILFWLPIFLFPITASTLAFPTVSSIFQFFQDGSHGQRKSCHPT